LSGITYSSLAVFPIKDFERFFLAEPGLTILDLKF
jgi:hypothetical protein